MVDRAGHRLRWRKAFLLPVLLLATVGCRSAASDRERLASANPLDQVTAAVRLAEAGDATAVHRLVALLGDRDRTVRMYAILALQRLCGRTYGYKYYADAPARAAAERRWQDALRDGEITLSPPEPSARTAASATENAASAEGSDEQSNE
ncbi:MAG: hypothetical protein PVJ57_11115 [Phycisphaerae bacterium]